MHTGIRASRAAPRGALTQVIAEASRIYQERHVTPRYVKTCLLSISRFVEWLHSERVPLAKVAPSDADRFVQVVVPSRQCAGISGLPGNRRAERAAARLAVKLLRNRYRKPAKPSSFDAEVTQYSSHVSQNRGLAAGTIENHTRVVRVFFAFCQQQGNRRPDQLRAEQIQEFISSLPATPTNSPRRMASTVLRAYLGYAEMVGRNTSRLTASIPSVQTSRSALRPEVPSTQHLMSLLRAVDRSSACGKRNYAAILCMSELGMRVGDVARIELSDIDWRSGTLCVKNHKTAKPFCLPMSDRVGRAIVDYLQNGRPQVTSERLFILHRGVGADTSVHALKAAVRRAWKKSRLPSPFAGTHILRHSAATRMKRSGIPLKTIADSLGHTAMQTATLYAQVDMPALRRVAQPWPRSQA